jgi:hypothetical protein
MKIIILLVIILLSGTQINAKKLTELPEVDRPFSILVKNNQLLIADRTVKLHLYSMKNFKYLKQISRKGSGPGECRHVPIFTIYPNCIFIFSRGKGMYFSRNGDYKNEIRVHTGKGISFISPLKDNFVALIKGFNTRNKKYYRDISLYSYTKDRELKSEKTLYYLEEPGAKIRGGKQDYTVINDYLGYIIHDDKVFVGDSTRRGLFVAAFDANGKEINRVHLLGIDKNKVTEQYKREFMEKGKLSPSYNIVKNMYNIVFPEYFPSFYRFAVDNGKVYFLTYVRKNDKREFIIANFKGDILKRTFVPWVENEANINFSIENDKFYYIVENEEEEVWELHMEEIK